jgi:hypothetical protein
VAACVGLGVVSGTTMPHNMPWLAQGTPPVAANAAVGCVRIALVGQLGSCAPTSCPLFVYRCYKAVHALTGQSWCAHGGWRRV